MSSAQPRVQFTFLKDFGSPDGPQEQLDDLRHQLEALPDFQQVELVASGRSTVVASVPARNQSQSDRLKALASERISGWRLIENQSYQLPATF